ncbi:alcohol-forming fatty acyl-CoA reductase [Salvia divinorum]|uniref:Fatty acyl-CoA reductase n=1 Tax=Salvia divinorum TaxID=28513 RepID=A0ABD1HLK5_SALDI
MLLVSAAAGFYPPTKPYCEGIFPTKFAANHSKMNAFSGKYHQTHSFSTKCCHLPASQLTAAAVDWHKGIGILDFFKGKNIFVIGATGLLGKAVVEKLLRSTSVDKIYLLIKAKDKEAALDRLQREIISSELFACLIEKYGTTYVREKLIPIVGDISKPNIGMDCESIDAVRKNVHVIIQSAASTTFNERLAFQS